MSNGSRVVVLGSGFAGVAVAQELVRLLPASQDCEVILVDQNNFFLFTPMLTEVTGGDADPEDIVTAIRALSPRITFKQGRVEKMDIENRNVTLVVGQGPDIPEVRQTIEADHLVIALGSVNSFHRVEGAEEYSLTIKTVGDATAIRNHALLLLERADQESDPQLRRALLTFVVAGGGFSGVETMAALNGLVRGVLSDYPRISVDDLRMVLAQPEERLLPELSDNLAAYTQRILERRGVEVLLKTAVSGVRADSVNLKEQGSDQVEQIHTYTLVWAAGVVPNPLIESAGLKLGKHHGIVVNRCCAVPDFPGVWALGDCAEVPQPSGGKTYAPTAQNASREGKQVGRNIAAVLRGEQPLPFAYRPVGELALVGKRAGVASLYGLHFSGFLAWAMWRGIYLAKLPTMKKRLRVGLGWLIELLFGRETAAVPGNGITKDTS